MELKASNLTDDVKQNQPTQQTNPAAKSVDKPPRATSSRDHAAPETATSVEPLRAATVTPVAADEVGADALDELLVAFQTFKQQQAAVPANDQRQQEMLRAVCATLITGPHQLGQSGRPAPLSESLRVRLQDTAPEARVCLLWLQCAAGESDSDSPAQFASLAQENLWEPLKALAWRALAHFGRRQTLAAVLHVDGPFSPILADAWLDASHTTELDANWCVRADTGTTDAILPALVREQWCELLAAEAWLAHSEPTAVVEATLASLASLADENIPQTYAAAQRQHIATRATAALVRARLARRGDAENALPEPAASFLPQWEQNYLLALARWQMGAEAGAIELLEAALEANPGQTPARLALATLLSAHAPEAALAALAHDEPTREVYAARANLFARMGCYTEAQNALSHCEGQTAAGGEPARFTFARGRAQARQREQILRAALAEHEDDWPSAEKFWRAAGAGVERKSWHDTRRLWTVQRELVSTKPGQQWRRSQIKQTWERGLHELRGVPLVGDALFFRAAALVGTEPESVRKDLQTLLRQNAWVEAEQQSGGGRLIFAGDLLWRLGQPDEARRAYKLAGEFSTPQLTERLAVAKVCVAVARSADAETISLAADGAHALAPLSHWPQLMAVLGLVRAGATEAARDRLDQAAASGAAENVCRVLRTLCGAAHVTAELAVEEISALNLPEVVAAVLRYLFIGGPDSERMDAMAQALGKRWLELCPTELQLTTQRLLAAWCEEDRWDEALECARALAHMDTDWAKDLWALVSVRHALTLALRGELETADDELRELEAALQSASE